MWQRLISLLSLVLVLTSDVSAAKRNVILFVTDDQGQDAGCYGNPAIKTPNLDRLAADGARFDYAFCTTASCSASRSVILTGMFNHANGHYGHQHSYHKFSSYPHIKSLPVLLNATGYRTARVGKYHVAPEEVYKFDIALPGNSRNPVQMAENSRDFIGNDSETPFFLFFCTSDPHRGGGNADELPHKPNRFGNLPPGKEYPGIDEVSYKPDEIIVPPFLPDTPVCRAELAQYYQSVSRIDQGLGKLVEILKAEDVYDDTLILYISDHGIAFPGGKTTVYEPGLRSPCIVRNPYLEKRGIACDAMVSWIDLTPTILDFAGALDRETGAMKEEFGIWQQQARRRGRDSKKLPYGFHGRSFLAHLDKESVDGWDEINASHTFHEITMYYPMKVVRTREWKLIWNIAHPLPYPFASDLWAAPTFQDRYQKGTDTLYGKRTVQAYMQRPEFELFHLKNDPDEAKNLAADPRYREKLDELKKKIRDFQRRTNDPWILKWDYE